MNTNICAVIVLLLLQECSTSGKDDAGKLEYQKPNENPNEVKPVLSRVKRQFGGYYDPYRRRPIPIPIVFGGGGFAIGGFGGFGGGGFGGRGFGGRGFGGRGFGGRGFGGVGGRGIGGFGGGRGGRG